MGHRLVSGLRDLIYTLTESLLSTSEAESLPRSDVLKYGGNLQTVALLLVVIALIAPLPLAYRPALPIVLIWIGTVLAYVTLYQFLPGLQRLPQRTIIHSFLAVGALLILNLMLLRVGYGRVGRDPNALWLAYLVPLLMISRHGKTRYWTLVLLTVSVVLVCFRLYSIWSMQAPAQKSLSDLISVMQGRAMFIAYRELVTILLVAAIYHATMREMHHYKSRVSIERELVDLLTAKPSFSAAYQAAAEAIFALHKPVTDYAFVLLMDNPSNRLKVVGISGLPLERWQDLELNANQGITGRVVEERQTLRVDDVRQPPWNITFYGPGQLKDVRSEMAAPVIVDEKVIGILDVESKKVGAYSRYHQAKLEAWAQALAMSYKHYQAIDRRVADAHLLFEKIVKLGQEHGRRQSTGGHIFYRSWFRAVAKEICTYFEADYASLLRLGMGTAYPLLPPIVWPPGELTPLKASFRRQSTVVPESIISRLIDEWEIRDWCTREEWDEWRDDVDQWLLNEFNNADVSSLFFIPIGGINNRLAMLFLGFRRPELLNDMGTLTLQGLATSLTTSFGYLSPWTSELHHAGIRIHQNVISRTQGTFARVDVIRNGIRRLEIDRHTIESLESTLDEIGDDVRKLRQQIKHATLHERFNLTEITLEHALKNTADDFQDIDPERLKIPVYVDGKVEDHELFVRQLLYWIAVEAVANAVEHGKANLVSVNIQSKPGRIGLTVIDDGIGLPPHPDRRQPHGIYYLQRLAYNITHAKLLIDSHSPNGVKVELSVPVRSDHL